MKKLRKISLENFDKLSSSEASRLIGGYVNQTIPPPKNTTPSSTTKPPVYATIKPSGGTVGGNIGNIGGSISGGSGGYNVSVRITY